MKSHDLLVEDNAWGGNAVDLLVGVLEIKRQFEFLEDLQTANHNLLLRHQVGHLYVDSYFDMSDLHGKDHSQREQVNVSEFLLARQNFRINFSYSPGYG